MVDLAKSTFHRRQHHAYIETGCAIGVSSSAYIHSNFVHIGERLVTVRTITSERPSNIQRAQFQSSGQRLHREVQKTSITTLPVKLRLRQ